MNTIAFINLLSTLISLVALVILLRGKWISRRLDSRSILAGMLLLMAAQSFSTYLEWSNIDPLMDAFEDFLGIFFPVLWGTLVYVIVRDDTEAALLRSEQRYLRLYKDSPISIREQDLSGIKACLDDLKNSGVEDLKRYLEENPSFVRGCMAKLRVLDVNKATLELYKFENLSELISNLDSVINTDPEQSVAELLAIAKGEPSFECYATDKSSDGGERYIHMSWSVLPGHERDYGRVVVSVVDITDRMLAQRRIERRLSFEQAISSISTWFLNPGDLDRAIQRSLAEIGRLTGAERVYTFQFRPDLKSMSNTHEWCAVGVPSVIESLQDLPSSSFPWWMGLLKLGETIHIEDVNAMPAEARQEKEILQSLRVQSLVVLPVSSGNRLIGFVGLDNIYQAGLWKKEDITLLRIFSELLGSALARSQVEKALSESEERYRTVVEDMPALICRFMKDGTLTYVNNHYCNYFNLGREKLIGANFFQFIPEDERDGVQAHYSGMGLENPVVSYEQRVFAPDGKVYWQHWTDRALFDDQGQVVEYQSIGMDITELKNSQDEREVLISTLEARNTELQQFNYTVSHDLKSPLITIRGFLDYLEEDARSGNHERMHSDVQRIRNAADKMEQLLDELLELSRIGRSASRAEWIDLNDLVRDALDTVQGRLSSANVKVIVDADMPEVFGDRLRLRQVLENLVDNGVKFMGDQPDPCIQIDSIESGGALVVRVKDNGIGIDPDYHIKVFGLFEKLSSKTEGSGVGLAIVQRIIDVHGGRVWVESEGLGKGSTFCFTLSPDRLRRDQVPV